MDRYLFEKAKRPEPSGYTLEIDSLLDSIKKYEGPLVADYHVRVFNDTFFPQWAESYRYLLKRVTASDDFYCDTPIGIAKHWLDREKRIFEKSKDEHCRTYE